MDEGFHGLKKLQKRDYWIDEVHGYDNIIKKWCIAVEVPEVNHPAMIFTISIRGYDNEPNNDDKNIKRPAIFNTREEAELFASELFFPDKHLRIVFIGTDVANHPLFIKEGAYLVKKPSIILPS
jgi:hypothetical protein